MKLEDSELIVIREALKDRMRKIEQGPRDVRDLCTIQRATINGLLYRIEHRLLYGGQKGDTE